MDLGSGTMRLSVDEISPSIVPPAMIRWIVDWSSWVVLCGVDSLVRLDSSICNSANNDVVDM